MPAPLLQARKEREHRIAVVDMAVRAAGGASRHAQVLVDGHLAEDQLAFGHQQQAGPGSRMGGQGADLAATQPDLTADPRRAARPAGDGIDQGGLAGAVGANHTDHLTSAHRDPVERERGVAAVGDGEIAGLQDRRGGWPDAHCVRPR